MASRWPLLPLGFFDSSKTQYGQVVCVCGLIPDVFAVSIQGAGCGYVCICADDRVIFTRTDPNLKLKCFFVPCPEVTLLQHTIGGIITRDRYYNGFPIGWCE